jgi:hypothetical protein
MIEKLGLYSRRRTEIFLFTNVSRPAVARTQAFIHWVPDGFYWGVKLIGRESNDLPPSFIKVKNAFLFENHGLMLERMFALPDDLKSYAGGSVSSW